MLKTFAKSQKPAPSDRDILLLALAATQLGQRVFTGGAAQIPDFDKQVAGMINTFSKLPWNRINFPVSATLMSQTYADIFAQHYVKDSDRNAILLESLFTFLNILADSPDYATESVLRGIVHDCAVSRSKVATPVELNYRANILKIFTPGNVTAIDLEPLQIVVYRGEMMGGGFGPELWGLAFNAAPGYSHLLLETGEYLKVPEPSLALAMSKDYATSEVPPYLLACARIFFPRLLNDICGEAGHATIEKLNKNLGTFTADTVSVDVIRTDELADCETLLDRARWSGDHTHTEGVIKTFNVSRTNEPLNVIVNAVPAAVRPYITSMLVDATGRVRMRLDVPREFSAYGVYLFPAGDMSAAIVSYSTV